MAFAMGVVGMGGGLDVIVRATSDEVELCSMVSGMGGNKSARHTRFALPHIAEDLDVGSHLLLRPAKRDQ